MTEREQFEEWIAENRPDVELYRRDVKGSTRFGEYCKSSAQESWEVWQESRRAALEEAAKVCDQMVSVSAISYETGSACAAAIRALSQHKKGEP
jgi:hypothetical protein